MTDLPDTQHSTATAPLIGRSRELSDVLALIGAAERRLVTITGAPGVGKTRLGIAVCGRSPQHRRVVVPLASVGELTHVMPAIADACGLRGAAERVRAKGARDWLSETTCLLLVDNAEHLDIGAQLGELLDACPSLCILATSRASLGLTCETLYPLRPLDCPQPSSRDPSVAELEKSASVALFTQRARFVHPGFRLDETNARAVADLCGRLDGLPLALELAAASVRVVTPQDMLAAFGRIGIPGSDCSDRPSRHRTLRDAIGWSYAQLPAPDASSFCRLAVFAGGFSVAGATALVGPHAMQTLTTLVDRNLVSSTPTAHGHTRFAMLETLREYALEQLEASGAATEARDLHLAVFLALAQEMEAAEADAHESALDVLDSELANLRAALRWSTEAHRAEEGLQLGGALWGYWSQRGHLTEGRDWLERLLSGSAGSREARARALTAAGTLAYQQGDAPAARALYEAALGLRRALDDDPGVAAALNGLGNVASVQGDAATARERLAESLTIRRRLGDRPGIAAVLNNLGVVAHDQGDLEAAAGYYRGSLEIERELGNEHGAAQSMCNLGVAALEQGDTRGAGRLLRNALSVFAAVGDRAAEASCLHSLGDMERAERHVTSAHAHYVASLEHWREVGDRLGLACLLESMAALAADGGDGVRALLLAGGARGLRRAVDTPLAPASAERVERSLDPARRRLAPTQVRRLLLEGESLGLEGILRVVEPSPTTSSADTVQLTPREREVVRLLACGLSNRSIAEQLGISHRTVDTHVTNVLFRLGVSRRTQIATWAAENGLHHAAPPTRRENSRSSVD